MMYPVIISAIITCNLSLICLAYFYLPADINFQGYDLKALKIIIPHLLMAVAPFLLFMVCWMYYVSGKVVGPYTRILLELDKIIENGQKRIIYVRKGDELFEELLGRINILIKKLPNSIDGRN